MFTFASLVITTFMLSSTCKLYTNEVSEVIITFMFFSNSYIGSILVFLSTDNYFQGTFLPLVVPPTLYQAGLWSTWLVVLCFLKVSTAVFSKLVNVGVLSV